MVIKYFSALYQVWESPEAVQLIQRFLQLLMLSLLLFVKRMEPYMNFRDKIWSTVQWKRFVPDLKYLKSEFENQSVSYLSVSLLRPLPLVDSIQKSAIRRSCVFLANVIMILTVTTLRFKDAIACQKLNKTRFLIFQNIGIIGRLNPN